MAKGLRLKNVQLRLGNRELLRLDHFIAPGEIATVMGPSGSGKSTLLAAITGTLPPEFTMSGSIVLDDQDISDLPTEERRIGILLQDDMLFPHMSVEENLAFGLKPEMRGRQGRREIVAAALHDVGLEGFAKRDPATLSGGQKARVSLMRALLAEPRALLLDEAFSKLDAELRKHVRQVVFDTARKKSLPVLQVTHDEADANAAGGTIIRLQTVKP
jgi:putative thiamine transport system ATP-binding protein